MAISNNIPASLIERKPYMQQLREWKDQHIIKVVTGMRRSGKSTMLKMLADEIRPNVDEAQIQFYNFEDIKTLAIGDYVQIYLHIDGKLVPDKMNYIFLDEVQNIASFERMADSLFIKENVDLYITGSNAYLLSGELATLLTGRYIEISILPFSFAEYLEYAVNSKDSSQNESFRNLSGLTLAQQSEIKAYARTIFDDYLHEGGIPQAVASRYKEDKRPEKILKAILSTIIEKDVFTRQEVYNKTAFSKIIDFLFDAIGAPISPNSIVNTFKSEKVLIDNKTVSRYLNILCDAFLLFRVPRYDLKGKGFLRTFEKYYLSDTGFRQSRLPKRMQVDIGRLLENVIYLELLRRYERVYIGKVRDKEVDFVVEDIKGYISYYQVAYSTMEPSTLDRELASLKAINDSNPKYLLTMDYDLNPVYDGIRKLNVIDWLLGIE
ncbi:MAG: ATP-binding protein [Mediterranea sp.]|jgi:predicted AAA+ superfamily ATPase|nr:ATP-binding protein [Mediterranea sp.]